MSPGTPKERAFRPRALAAALVLLAIAVAYHNGLDGPFIFDDRPAIMNNPGIRSLWSLRPALPTAIKSSTTGGRPVLSYSFALNYALGGLEVQGYHVVNVIVHMSVALVLFEVLRRSLLSPALRNRYGAAALPLALGITLLWAVHPLQTESVTYVSQRAESLVALFYLLTLYCLIRAGEAGRALPWGAGAVVACLLGMGSKEVMITAPVMALLYDRTFMAGSFRRAWEQRGWLHLGLASTWVVLAALMVSNAAFAIALEPVGGAARWRYLLIQTSAITRYLALSFWPHPLVLDYGQVAWRGTMAMLPHAVVVGSLLGLTLAALWRNAPAGFAGAMFFAVLAPTSSVFPLKEHIWEHRMYLPLAAVIILAVLGVWTGWDRLARTYPRVLGGNVRWGVTGALLAALACALTTLTLARNRDYASAVSIWSDTVAKRPGNTRARTNLGIVLSEAKREKEALREFERALSLDPGLALAHLWTGAILMARGEHDAAIGHFRRASVLDPNDMEIAYELGRALALRGLAEEASELFRKVNRLRPDHTPAMVAMAKLLAEQGEYREAADLLIRAREIRPDSLEASVEYGRLLLTMGRPGDAIEVFGTILDAAPKSAGARSNFAIALAAAGRFDEAREHLAVVLRQDPGNAEARRLVALVGSAQTAAVPDAGAKAAVSGSGPAVGAPRR